MAVDAFLIISAIVLACIILAVITMIVVVFGHPDDKNEAYFPKVVVTLGLFLAVGSVLVLPYDVANARGNGGGLDIGLLWQIVFWTTALFVTVLIPFAFFFYESDLDPEDVADEGLCAGQFWVAFKYTLMFFAVFLLIFILLFSFLNEANIPVQRITYTQAMVRPLVVNGTSQAIPALAKKCSLGEGDSSTVRSSSDASAADVCIAELFKWNLEVSFPVYLIAVLSFLGWFLFTVFAGVGLAALPFELINEYRTRPQLMSLPEYSKYKESVGRRAQLLHEAGQALLEETIEVQGSKRSRKQRNADRRTFHRFEQAVYMLKRDFTYMQVAFHLKGGNPLFYVGKLLLGIVGGVVSFTWVLHMVLFIIPPKPVSPFLNDIFTGLEFDGFDLFGVVMFGLWSLWLLGACIKGAFRVGLRVPFLLRIYPMEIRNTYMNAFLVNTWIILICSVPTVQLCALAFPIYARATDVNVLFGNQVQFLKFFSSFFENNVFVWAIVIFALLTSLMEFFNPTDKAAKIESELQRVASGEAAGSAV